MTNHVKKNIHLSSKITKIRDIRTFCRNQHYDEESQRIKKFNQELDQFQRQMSQQQGQKWELFKFRKKKVMEKYIITRKNIFKIQYLIKLVVAHKFLRTACKNFKGQKTHCEKLKRIFAVYSLSSRLWRRFLARYGKARLNGKTKNQIRHSLVLQSQVMSLHHQPRLIIADFCQNIVAWAMTANMQSQARVFHRLVNFIQIRMKQKLQTQFAKVEAVTWVWDKLLFVWYGKAIELKDEGMKKLVNKILAVKQEVRHYVLLHYIKQCEKRHAIAFLEWRLHFCKARKRYKKDDFKTGHQNFTTQMKDREIATIIKERSELLKG